MSRNLAIPIAIALIGVLLASVIYLTHRQVPAGTAPPDIEAANNGNRVGNADAEPLIDEDPEESEFSDTITEAENVVIGASDASRTATELFESTWADYQEDPLTQTEGYQRALDAEEVDSNWGPLIEAAIVGSTAKNDGSLLTLTAQCKTTICLVEVEQVGVPPTGFSPRETTDLVRKWYDPLRAAVIETGLDVWQVRFSSEMQDEGELTRWRAWVLRTPPPQ